MSMGDERLGIFDQLQQRAKSFADRHPALKRHIQGKGPDVSDAKATQISVDCATGERSISDIISEDVTQAAIAKRTAELVAIEIEKIAKRRAAERMAEIQIAPRPYLVPIRSLFDAVTEATEFSYDELIGPRRSKVLSKARQIVYYLLGQLRPDLSYPAIGRVVGGRDHTTPLCGIRKFLELRGEPPFIGWLQKPSLIALIATADERPQRGKI